MPKLILTLKDQRVIEYPLKRGTTTIGRHDSNDIVIDHRAVSGLHAHVDYQGEEIVLTDLGSKNGTYHNGQPIIHAVLRNNDKIRVGQHTITVITSEDDDSSQ